MRHILLVGKENRTAESLSRLADGTEVQVDWADKFSEAISLSAKMQYDAALINVSGFDSDTAEFIKTLREQSPQTLPTVIAPALDVEQVMEAMRCGASDFVDENCTAEEIMERVARLIESRRMKNEIDFLRHTQPIIYRFDDIVGVSAPMKSMFSVLRKVAPTDATVLILGETGTGKELIAGATHFNSKRAKSGFIKVNCAALPENLLESELFGHEKGAFTGAHRQRVGRFEQADTGTIFLDEIGDMGLSTQAKILRVLQEHEFERLGGTQTINVDVRVIAATNKDLSELMNSGQFREDLFYRLNVVTIELAPLRHRIEDIEPLAEFFLKKYMRQVDSQVKVVSTEAMKMLKEYYWPGNVRQLQNVIERAVIMCDGGEVLPEHLALFDKHPRKDKGVLEIPEGGIKLEDVERLLIIQALERTGWVQKKAAELLGISPRVINYKIRKHKIKEANK